MKNFEDLALGEAASLGVTVGNKVLKIHVSALHDDVGVLSLRVLIDLMQCDKVSDVSDHKATHF